MRTRYKWRSTENSEEITLKKQYLQNVVFTTGTSTRRNLRRVEVPEVS